MERSKVESPGLGREMRRKNFYVSLELEKRAEVVAANLGVDFSHLLREALRLFVESAERAELDRELARACEDYKAFNREFSSEWAGYETRIE
jgi:hypothetical protein